MALRSSALRMSSRATSIATLPPPITATFSAESGHSRAPVGKNCHIGAGTVLAGVVEPASATPVIIEDDVMIGANAVVLEGVHVGKGAVVAAGAVCVEDVPAGAVVAGVPARVIKMRDEKTDSKTGLEEGLRRL